MKRVVTGTVVAMCLAVTSSTFGGDSRDPRLLPAAAARIIDRVRQAAQKRDLTNLRKLMVREFIWSFGGDRDADQAVEAWKDDPRYLREMARVLEQGCHIDVTRYGSERTKHRVKCPGTGNLSFRAGFIHTPDGWCMEYFVEGD